MFYIDGFILEESLFEKNSSKDSRDGAIETVVLINNRGEQLVIPTNKAAFKRKDVFC